MDNFTFQNPVKIIFGKGEIASLSSEISTNETILLTYGGGSIFKNGVMDQTRAALKNHTVIEFGGIEPNPQFSTLMKAVKIAQEKKCTFLLAVGGGSVLDGTKFIAAAINAQGDPWDIVVNQAPVNNPLPIGAILTLPATGSEMNGNSVVSRKETNDKRAFSNPSLYPAFSILDPETTTSLPPVQTANGIVDAFVHITEQYLTYPQNAPVQDRMAEGLLKTLIEEGPKALQNPNDYTARANVMWAATMALNGLLSLGVVTDWASHMLGHEITAEYGLDHGQTLAILLPAVMQARKERKKDKILQYAERVWNITEGDENTRINTAIAKTITFFESLNMPASLQAYNLPENCIEQLCERITQRNMNALGENGEITLDISRKIYQTAWENNACQTITMAS